MQCFMCSLSYYNKTILEQVKLIQKLEPEEKTNVFKMIDTFLSKKSLKLL